MFIVKVIVSGESGERTGPKAPSGWSRRTSTSTMLSLDEIRDMSWNAVYSMVKRIPRGRVMTYGALAKTLKLPGGARTAGRALAASPQGRGIPWHRVIGAGGRLLLREPHVALQRKLLESEGITVVEKRVRDFASREWVGKRKIARTATKLKSGPQRRIRGA